MARTNEKTGTLASYAYRVPHTTRAALSYQKTEKNKNDRSAVSDYQSALAAAEARYLAEAEALAQEKNAAMRRAAVNRTLLGRYLDTQKASEGMRGLGVSESARIEANNALRREEGEAMREYAEGERSVRGELAKAQTELTKYYGESNRKSQDDYFKRMLEKMKNESFSGIGELNDMLALAKDFLRPEQYAQLVTQVEYYKRHPVYSEWE